MRKMGKLKFKNAGPILKEYCRYDDDNGDFIYKSSEKHPNYLLKFKVRNRRGNFRNIPNSHFKLNEQIKPFGVLHDLIFDLVFNSEHIMKTYSEIWWRKVEASKQNENTQSFWQNYELGYYFVLILVIAFLLGKQENKGILEEINRIKILYACDAA